MGSGSREAIDSPGELLGKLAWSLKVGDGMIDRFLEQGDQFRKVGRRLIVGELLFTFPANIRELGHTHGACGAFKLVKDPTAFLDSVVGESGLEGHQLVSSVRGKVVHDGKQKTGLAGCHGIELGVIKEGHGSDYTRLRALGKEQGQGRPEACGAHGPTKSGYICRWGRM